MVAASTMTVVLFFGGLSDSSPPWSSAEGVGSSVPLPTPSICTISSVFTRRLASCSPSAPRAPARESISSKNMVAGA